MYFIDSILLIKMFMLDFSFPLNDFNRTLLFRTRQQQYLNALLIRAIVSENIFYSVFNRFVQNQSRGSIRQQM